VLQDWLKWYEHIRVFSFQVSNFWSVLPLLVRGVANHGQMYKCVCMCFVSRQGKNPRVMQFHVRTKCMINEKRRYRRKRSFGSFDFGRVLMEHSDVSSNCTCVNIFVVYHTRYYQAKISLYFHYGITRAIMQRP
jgi:hypothetical protein